MQHTDMHLKRSQLNNLSSADSLKLTLSLIILSKIKRKKVNICFTAATYTVYKHARALGLKGLKSTLNMMKKTPGLTTN